MHLCTSDAYPFIATFASRYPSVATPGTYVPPSTAAAASSFSIISTATAPSFYSSMLLPGL